MQFPHFCNFHLTSVLISAHLQAFYWATSEWSAQELEEAYRAAATSIFDSPVYGALTIPFWII